MKYATANIIAKILLIIFALLIDLMLNSCMSYRKAKNRYAKTVTDTIRISKEVILKIPKDSVQYRFITDTIPFYDEVRQGRATIKVQYRDRVVTVKADCDSASKSETVTLKVPQQITTWGVANWYKEAFLVSIGCILSFIIIHFAFQKRQ